MAQPTSKSGGRAVYIVDGSRTPFLKAAGKPGPFLASEMAVQAGRQLLARQPFEPDAFDEVIMGCVMPTADEANIARVVSLRLGCGKSVPAWTVQRNCASGMQAIDNAYANIASGRSDLILAGGVESMSHAPILLNTHMVNWLANWNRAKSFGQKLGALSKLRGKHLVPVVGLLRGLTDPINGLGMGHTAEILAHRFDISREQMDAYAAQSHHRLAKAQDEGWLDAEVEALYDTRGNHYLHDDGLRRDSSVEKLAKLRPVFDRNFGRVTAGNSAQVTDGAAMLSLASEEAVKKYQLNVLGRIADSEWAGLEPAQMGLGPVHAMTPIMRRKRWKVDAIDYWELNEAFATQVLACVEAWKEKKYCVDELNGRGPFGEIPMERLNVDGGGVSLGHPVGASGARWTNAAATTQISSSTN